MLKSIDDFYKKMSLLNKEEGELRKAYSEWDEPMKNFYAKKNIFAKMFLTFVAKNNATEVFEDFLAYDMGRDSYYWKLYVYYYGEERFTILFPLMEDLLEEKVLAFITEGTRWAISGQGWDDDGTYHCTKKERICFVLKNEDEAEFEEDLEDDDLPCCYRCWRVILKALYKGKSVSFIDSLEAVEYAENEMGEKFSYWQDLCLVEEGNGKGHAMALKEEVDDKTVSFFEYSPYGVVSYLSYPKDEERPWFRGLDKEDRTKALSFLEGWR